MQFRLLNYEYRFNWFASVFTLLCMIVFIKLGLWQYHKAEYRQRIEDQYQASLQKQDVQLLDYLEQPELLQYQRVAVTGEYQPQYQILLDNQVEAHQAGFHVITPFKLTGVDKTILVNRGWIAGGANHQAIPSFNTPAGERTLLGMVWIPSDKIFTLEDESMKPDANQWQTVWQHLDMKRYQDLAPMSVMDVIIKLSPAQKEGGFVRNWQMPPSKIMTNLGYAYQWFGFAFAALAIYLYTSIRKIK